MAGIDILNQFPNSKMAAAAQLGQSRFRSVESTSAITPAQKTGSAVLTGVSGNTSTAALLTLCGLTTSFSEIMLTITTSATGVPITVGGGPVTRYPQGQSATFNDVTLTSNQLQVGTASADVVTINYVGV